MNQTCTSAAATDTRTAAVIAIVHSTAEAWNSQEFSKVLELWDPAEPLPFYLAEEQDDWFIGWEPLKNYLVPVQPSPAVQGIREEMRDITVKFIAADLAIAVWWMHFEMKIIGRKPIGEEVRVSAVLRQTAAGWRYIHWAESPMTASMYLMKLMERDVDQEKFAGCHTRAMQRWQAVRKKWQ
ncbi:MAG: nuclear transport factor 2 family protein [Gammaproteobacteria bacterium]